MKMIKSFVAAAALMAAASSAFATATVVNLTQSASNPLDYTGGFNLVHNGAFTDTFTFTPVFSSSLVSAVLTSIGFTSVTDINFTSVKLNGVSLNIVNGLVDSASTLTQLNISGPLSLVVSGTSGLNASYSGTINVTAAVPEPETYALMLGGLGLVGFAARRRKAANQA
jgi:hypothetical protein